LQPDIFLRKYDGCCCFQPRKTGLSYLKNMNWYVLYTAPRAEKQVEQRLKANGVEVYLPLHYTPRKWSDRVKMVEVPLFSSYIFVKTTDEVLRTLLKTNGVSRIVFYNSSPAVVREAEIDAIKEFVDAARGKECSFIVDEEVLVACGPLKSLSGKVCKVLKKWVVLHIEQIGLTVTLNQDQIIRHA